MLTQESATRKDARTGLADMQHRHFTTIATIIREANVAESARQEMEDVFAARLNSTNPKFDVARFRRACKR